MSLRSQIRLALAGTHLTTSGGLARVTVEVGPVWAVALDDGVGADQADSIFSLSAQEIASGGTLSLDLQGALEDVLGNAFTPAKLRAVCIVAARTNTTVLTLFGGAAPVPVLGGGGTHTLNPGGIFFVLDRSAAGIPVTAATADILRIVNGSGAVAKVDVVLIGTSS